MAANSEDLAVPSQPLHIAYYFSRTFTFIDGYRQINNLNLNKNDAVPLVPNQRLDQCTQFKAEILYNSYQGN